VEEEVLERSSADRDLERIHGDEVEGDHIAGVMDLGEVDFLLDALLELPPPDAPLQCAADRVGDARLASLAHRRVMFLLQPLQEGVGLELPIVPEPFLDLRPELLQRIGPRAIGSRRPFNLTGEELSLLIFANGLGTHVEPPRNVRPLFTFIEQEEHLARANILDHDQPPVWGT
jgi:hypothetical protein